MLSFTNQFINHKQYHYGTSTSGSCSMSGVRRQIFRVKLIVFLLCFIFFFVFFYAFSPPFLLAGYYRSFILKTTKLFLSFCCCCLLSFIEKVFHFLLLFFFVVIFCCCCSCCAVELIGGRLLSLSLVGRKIIYLSGQ